MRYLLDTNACIAHLRRPGRSFVTARLRQLAPADVCVPSIVRAELLLGTYLTRDPLRSMSDVRAFLGPFPSLPFDDRAAEVAARVGAELRRIGQTIGSNDLLIAAVAMANGLVMVTHNTREFGRINGLQWEDWER